MPEDYYNKLTTTKLGSIYDTIRHARPEISKNTLENATDLQPSLSTLLQALEDPESLQLNKQICFALYSASLAMTKAYSPMLSAVGLTYPQYLVMLVLWEEDGLGVKEIGKRLYLDSGTLTSVLKRLEKSGFVARERLVEDERRVRVSLTEAGHSLKSDMTAIRVQLACRSDLSVGEMIALQEQISNLRDSLLVNEKKAPIAPAKR